MLFFRDSGEARHLVFLALVKSAVKISSPKAFLNPSTASVLHNSTVSTVLNLAVS